MSKYIIDTKTFNKLMELASDNDIEHEIFEGALVDNGIVYSDKMIKFKGIRRTKYIIIEENYLNEWSSELVMIVTDSDKKAMEFVEKYSNEECLV